MRISPVKYLIVLIFTIPCLAGYCQDYDSVRLAQLPRLTLPEALKSAGLPYKVDNSRSPHFPPIFTQYGYSCNQSASIAVDFTYELNALRNLDGSALENRLPPFFTWNMMNRGNADTGVSYFESWDMIRAIGCPNWWDYGTSMINATRWMNGYYQYLRGMKNRIEDIWSIDVSNEQGLLTLKHWLYDHLGEYQPGGMGNFQLATLDLRFVPLPAGTEDAGKLMIPAFNYAVGHAMTFVGYNDSVRYDFNGDGRYTNNIDTNGDGQVTMADWEIGALICVNTYGTEWGSEGRAYVPYRILPLTPDQGGIWQKSVVVAKPRKNYQPHLTLQARIRYPYRSKIWITAGVSQNPDATVPEHILDQPVFHYQGGNMPMQGQGPADPEMIEIGIDATPLLGYVESGQPARFFLIACEQDPESVASGLVENFSFNEYEASEIQYLGNQMNTPLDQPFLAIPVTFTPQFERPEITTTELPGAVAGQDYKLQLEATGGKVPYKWTSQASTYTEERFNAPFPSIYDNKVLPDGANFDKKTVELPFDFPYHGKVYRQMTLSTKGAILFAENNLFIPYGYELRELLGMNSSILPFYSTEFHYEDYLNGVYYEPKTSAVTVYWNASLGSGGQVSDANFSVRLYPNGQIEFYYGNFVNKASQPWLIGMTGGSKSQSYYPDINATGIFQGLNIRFQAPVLPEGFNLSADGILSCRPLQAGRVWSIPVCVEDYQGVRTYRNLTLATAAQGTGNHAVPSPVVSVYPNPVTDRAYVQVESVAAGDIRIKVVDLTGREVAVLNRAVGAGRTVFTLKMPESAVQGIYILEATGLANFRTKIYLSCPAR